MTPKRGHGWSTIVSTKCIEEVLLHTDVPRTVLEPMELHGLAIKNLINYIQYFKNVCVVCFHALGHKLWEGRNYVLSLSPRCLELDL